MRARPWRARALRGAWRALAALPWPAVRAAGAALGWGLAWLPNELRRAARVNLALCFPDLPAAERRRLLRRTLVETGRAMAEAGPLWGWPAERALALVREVRGEQALREALAAGRGAILAVPHLGAWELVGLYCSRYRVTALYRPLRVPELEGLVRAARERAGARLVPATAAGVRALHRALARGGLVGLLPDQRPAPGAAAALAPFFGVPAPTGLLLPRLARRSGAPVILAWALRRPRGGGFALRFRPLPPLPEGDAEAAAALNRAVEEVVREAPEQYQWGYRRFRREGWDPYAGPVPPAPPASPPSG